MVGVRCFDLWLFQPHSLQEQVDESPRDAGVVPHVCCRRPSVRPQFMFIQHVVWVVFFGGFFHVAHVFRLRCVHSCCFFVVLVFLLIRYVDDDDCHELCKMHLPLPDPRSDSVVVRMAFGGTEIRINAIDSFTGHQIKTETIAFESSDLEHQAAIPTHTNVPVEFRNVRYVMKVRGITSEAQYQSTLQKIQHKDPDCVVILRPDLAAGVHVLFTGHAARHSIPAQFRQHKLMARVCAMDNVRIGVQTLVQVRNCWGLASSSSSFSVGHSFVWVAC